MAFHLLGWLEDKNIIYYIPSILGSGGIHGIDDYGDKGGVYPDK